MDLTLDPITKAIWTKFHVHYNDVLPYMGYRGTRVDLAQLFCELGYTKGAEIGVEAGRYSKTLCRNNPSLKLMSVDPWEPFSHHSAKNMEDTYQTAVLRLKGCNVEFVRKRSLDAVKDVPDKSLDFVYIDALHEFDHVMQDLIAWAPKVRVGGIVAGHDYIKMYGYGVIDAVNTYTRVHGINLWYITTERDPRVDGSPSWFYVKF